MPLIVYEAINDTLREIFVGTSSIPLDQLQLWHRADAPKILSHWKLGEHKTDYREIASAMPDADAMTFIKSYTRSIGKPDWKILTEP